MRTRKAKQGIRLEYGIGAEVNLAFRWSVSRARDSYGYNVCTLRADGVKVAGCNGGGYDMLGTCLGDFIARAFPARLVERIGAQASKCERCNGTGHVDGNIMVGNALEGRPWGECHECRGTGKAGAFYGLTFHDPDFDPGKAEIQEAAIAGDLGGSMTVAEAEAAGKSLGLERYHAFYRAASPFPDDKHRIPLIDGACGWSSVTKIAEAIGLTLSGIRRRSRDASDRFYILTVGP